MADPFTSNIGLAVPTRGSDVGTWDLPINGDFNAIDGLFGGVLTVPLSNANVTLTAPTGFTTAPNAGPVQSQNAVIRLTGTLSANLTVVLPVPGFYIIDNLTLAPGFGESFIAGLRAPGGGEVIYLPIGFLGHVYSDGTNVRFVNIGKTGDLIFLGGVISLPSCYANCTVPPFLNCNGAIYSFSQFPRLGLKYGANFGGNGSTTFGVPDLGGRVNLAYDYTGARITSGIAGFNGAVLGGAGGDQNFFAHIHGVSASFFSGDDTPDHNHQYASIVGAAGLNIANGSGVYAASTSTTGGANQRHHHLVSFAVNSSQVGSGVSQNIPPSLVSGIWVVKT